MKQRFFLILLVFVFIGCNHPPFSLNYRDKKDLLQGKWKVYYPDTKKIYYKGRFHNSVPKKLTYYYPNGRVSRIDKYLNSGNIHTIFYYENGVKDLEGNASLVQNGDTSLYQWQGPWQKYDSTGKHIEEQTYRRGYIIWVKKIK